MNGTQIYNHKNKLSCDAKVVTKAENIVSIEKIRI